jgi:ADP-heptose:LPS heptosyltransferase
MKVKKRLGIWMDHTVARLMEYTAENYQVKTIEAEFSAPVNQQNLLHSESAQHNKDKQAQKAYYKELIEVIKNYEEVVLFGPTAAKTELYNLIRADHRFDAIKIETKPANKMSYEQQHTFIQDYFAKLLNYESPYSK